MNFGKGADFHALYPGSSGKNNRTMVLLFLGKKRKNLLDFLPLGLLINIHCTSRAFLTSAIDQVFSHFSEKAEFFILPMRPLSSAPSREVEEILKVMT